MTFRGEDIFSLKVPRSGIQIENPEFEWRSAAHFAHYKFEDFQALEGVLQSRIVAHYRCHQQMEAVVADAMARDRAMRMRRNGSKR